jgi:catechol 2,3-dioxygenase-like lactoylglutathione lyase family enzyme
MIAGVHHVKIPVSDVAASRDWYERVLGLQVSLEFVEDGTLMGVALADPAGAAQIALRHDPGRSSALAGFDPLALAVATRDDIEVWRRALDDLGEPHGGIVTGSSGGAVLVGLRDPDGIEIRLYAD